MANAACVIVRGTARVRLPLAFDAARLAHDADDIDAALWAPHFNRALFRGHWSGVTLRGKGARLYPNPYDSDPVEDLPMLEHCSAVRDLLRHVACETTSVRFLRLGPDSEIYEHRDYDLTPEGGEARLHVCIRTNPDVTFFVDGASVDMRPGDCWYLDVSRPHRVVNRGEADRLHLVIDCLANDWLNELIASGEDG